MKKQIIITVGMALFCAIGFAQTNAPKMAATSPKIEINDDAPVRPKATKMSASNREEGSQQTTAPASKPAIAPSATGKKKKKYRIISTPSF